MIGSPLPQTPCRHCGLGFALKVNRMKHQRKCHRHSKEVSQ